MHCLILVTASGEKEAQRIAQGLIKDKLVACVNIIKGVKAYFWWQGKIDASKEVLLIIKSRKKLIPKVIKKVKSLHSYEVPEIIALPIISGYKKYLDWIDESTS